MMVLVYDRKLKLFLIVFLKIFFEKRGGPKQEFHILLGHLLPYFLAMAW